MNEYNKLTYKECKDIAQQIDEGMRTTNGDTAPIELTARQAAVLLWTYGTSKRPGPQDHIFAHIQYMLKETPEETSMFE